MIPRLVKMAFSQQRLFTPGPLNLTESVRSAMLVDYGSRDPLFLNKLTNIRQGILDIADANANDYTAVIMQGSGTYALEATLHTCVAPKDKVLVVTNGSYGERQVEILQKSGRMYEHMSFDDNQVVDPVKVIERLDRDSSITHVGMVHSETTSGLINSIDFLRDYSRPIHLIVDSMSSFGAYPVNVVANNIDFLISSSNKCVQGAPGFAFVVAKKTALYKYRGNATSLVLDLVDQDEGIVIHTSQIYYSVMTKTNQFRFTPPTHVLAAFEQALREHQLEGGNEGRFHRYDRLQRYLWEQMQDLGFRPYLTREAQGCIITTFNEPTHPNYNFKKMYDFLAERNCVIYPGKKTKAPTFRIGSIGDLNFKDMQQLLGHIKEYLKHSEIPVPVTYN